ncbi:four helix bundle protein [Candidatus Uhrbacteria bacterium]|nr:four helix bundle protein [Candidatus Uhrbacteria bacterium]
MDDFRKRFSERLIAYAIDAIALSGELRKKPPFYPIADQYLRSATSIGANVTEARASSSRKDYTRFFEIALKSANEAGYWLVLIERSLPELADRAQQLRRENDEIAKILGRSVKSLKDNQ